MCYTTAKKNEKIYISINDGDHYLPQHKNDDGDNDTEDDLEMCDVGSKTQPAL